MKDPMAQTPTLAQGRTAGPGRARLLAGLALGAMAALALAMLLRAEAGLQRQSAVVGATPVTITTLAGAPPGPAVVIAHGFAGSRPLMRAFAAGLARAGYVAVSFDFLGHGRHPEPMTGDLGAIEGATARLVGQTLDVAAFARALPQADGRVALLGHSMAGDVIVRAAQADGGIAGVVAVSMFSPAVTADSPANLLAVAGEYEAGLAAEAMRALRLAAGPGAEPGRTHGDPAAGTARRAFVAPGVEHVGVLFSRSAIAEAVAWMDLVFARPASGAADARGPWVALLLAALAGLGWPLAGLLRRLRGRDGADVVSGAGLSGWRFALAALGPAALTPLLLRAAEPRFLPIIVGDYLAAHLAAQGLLTLAALWALGARRPGRGALVAAVVPAGLVCVYALGAFGQALDAWVAAFQPTPARAGLLLALLPGAAAWFLADEWLTRGPGAPPLAYPLTKIAFLASLAGAVALDFERLFFLLILTPVLVLFFVLFGLFSRWTMGATGNPLAGGLANAVILAWAVAATFPLAAG
jgi:hypothetical protein